MKALKIILSLSALIFTVLSAAESIPENPRQHFSPNLDGVKDSMIIPLKIQDDALAKWTIEIYDSKSEGKQRLRLFESKSAREIVNMDMKKFVSRIFQAKEPVIIPEFVAWDGIAQVVKEDGQVESYNCADGIYYFQISAFDDSGNKASSELIPFVLDTIRPKTTLKTSPTVFSPNGDGRKEKLNLEIGLSDFRAVDRLFFHISNVNSAVAERVALTTDSESALSWSWDGKVKGKDTAEGSYKYWLHSYDPAGNQFSSEKIDLRLVRSFETVQVSSEANIISPNGDGYFDSTIINTSVSSLTGLEDYSILVKQAESVFFEKKLSAPFSEKWLFEGVNTQNKRLKDGSYELSLQLNYDSGNQIQSKPIAIAIDTSAAKLQVSTEYPAFVPVDNSDGNKTMAITQEVQGDGSETFSAEILTEKGQNVFSIDFKKELPERFTWDGKDKNGDIVPGRYIYRLQARDAVGNTASTDSTVFELIGEKSEIRLTAGTPAFSPNSDGVKDSISFLAEVNNQSAVKESSVSIMDSRQKEVTSMKSSGFQKNWSWDGMSSGGKKVADGLYEVLYQVTFTTGEALSFKGRKIAVDTQPVSLELNSDTTVFSPNGDGRKEQIVFQIDKKPSAVFNDSDKLAYEVIDPKGTIWLKAAFENNAQLKWSWDGQDQAGNPAPEGKYALRINTRDLAGNSSQTLSEAFHLVRKSEKVNFTYSSAFSSRNGLDENKKIEIIPSFSSKEFLKGYTTLLKREGQTLYKNEVEGMKSTVFEGEMPSGTLVKDGRYDLVLQAQYTSGNQPISEAKTLIVDNQGPSVQIQTLPEYFSPDNDGVDDILQIGLQIQDENGVEQSAMRIYRRDQRSGDTLGFYLENNVPPFKEWKYRGSQNGIVEWNGSSEEGIRVESANDYSIFVISRDQAGNRTVEHQAFTIDVLVERLADGRLKIIINSINFESGRSRLQDEDKPTLQRLSTILEKFPNYKIEIIGHTDSVGSEKNNEELSIRRAKSVYNYLVDLDLAREQMSYSGKGESELLEKNEVVEGNKYATQENRRKNRRVEFYLIKNPE